MAFVDEMKVSVRAGKGGNGVVRWLNMKGLEMAGPAGGDGGRGGDVVFEEYRASVFWPVTGSPNHLMRNTGEVVEVVVSKERTEKTRW